MNIYGCNDYRALLVGWEQSENSRGARSRLAKAAQASPSWMTQVLTGDVQLTPDQAMGISTFLHLNESETDYFLLLVDLERAATMSLKTRIQKKLDTLKKESRKLAASVKTDSSISDENTAHYYSSWVYAAVHVSCMNKGRTVDEISHELFIAKSVIATILNELRDMGLLGLNGVRWRANSMNVHLPTDHPMIKLAHAGWRNRTIQFLNGGEELGLHYSAVHCLSKADIETIREILRKTILNCRRVIDQSPSEVLGVFCLDWYKL